MIPTRNTTLDRGEKRGRAQGGNWKWIVLRVYFGKWVVPRLNAVGNINIRGGK